MKSVEKKEEVMDNGKRKYKRQYKAIGINGANYTKAKKLSKLFGVPMQNVANQAMMEYYECVMENEKAKTEG